jgi:hypothetical protein
MMPDPLTDAAEAINSRSPAEVTARLRRLLDESIGEIVQLVVDAAKEGDYASQRLLIERSIPIPKSEPLRKPIKLTGTIPEKAAQVREALADGVLTLDEAEALTKTLLAEQTMVQNAEVVDRLARLERQLAALGTAVRGEVIDATVEEPPRGLPAPKSRGREDEF